MACFPEDGKCYASFVPTKKLPLLQELPDKSPMYVHFGRTPIDVHLKRSTLSEDAFGECRARTCPASCTGPLQSLIPEPAKQAMAARTHAAAPAKPPVIVLSLAEAFPKPAQPPTSVLDAAGQCSPSRTLAAAGRKPAPGPLLRSPPGLDSPRLDAAGRELAQGPLLLRSPPGLDSPRSEASEAGALPVPAGPLNLGSQGHAAGQCKPCAFFHTTGCNNGLGCSFCHLCEVGEGKRRKQQNRALVRAALRLRRAAAAA